MLGARKAIVVAVLAATAGTAGMAGTAHAQRGPRVDPVPLAQAAAGPRPAGPVPGEVLVAFRRSTTASQRSAARSSAGVTVRRALRIDGVQLVRTRRGVTTADAIRALQRDPAVRYAEPNRWRRPSARTPDDPLFPALWGLRNTGQNFGGFTGGLPDRDIDAPEAWDLTTGAPVLVAVVDTGVAYDHPDLAPNMWRNPGETAANGVDDDGNGFVDDVHGADTAAGDGDPRDLDGHGTHVAGTIAARGDNARGVAGVSWGARIMAVRALGPFGGDDATVAEAFDYAADMGARVVNASLGGPGGSATLRAPITEHPGTLFVVAAGNGGDDGVGDDNDDGGEFPCAFPDANLVCVAATDQADGLATFSNFGRTTVDLGAPGTEILSGAIDVGAQVLDDDFEAGDFGTRWVPNGTPGTWARTAGNGGFVASDSPGGAYTTGAQNYLDSVPLNVAGRDGCVVDFVVAGRMAPGDAFVVLTSVDDGATWQAPLAADDFDTGGAFVAVRGLALGNEGASSLILSFGIEADADGVNADGVAVDDVVVRCVRPETGEEEYAVLDGTSMATPHVAGAAALLLGFRPHLTPTQAASVLRSSGDQVAALAGVTTSGRRLNADAALRPAVTTGAATAVTDTGATLEGAIDPRGGTARYHFEHGPGFGARTPTQQIGGVGARPVSAAVAGLPPSTTQTFRLVAVQDGVTYTGRAVSFTTAATPAPPPPSAPPEPGPPPPPDPGPGTPLPEGGALPATSGSTTRRTPVAQRLARLVRTARPSCRRTRRRLVCRVRASGTARVRMTLRRGRHTVATGTASVGRSATMRLRRRGSSRGRLRAGRYTLTIRFVIGERSRSVRKQVRLR